MSRYQTDFNRNVRQTMHKHYVADATNYVGYNDRATAGLSYGGVARNPHVAPPSDHPRSPSRNRGTDRVVGGSSQNGFSARQQLRQQATSRPVTESTDSIRHSDALTITHQPAVTRVAAVAASVRPRRSHGVDARTDEQSGSNSHRNFGYPNGGRGDDAGLERRRTADVVDSARRNGSAGRDAGQKLQPTGENHQGVCIDE